MLLIFVPPKVGGRKAALAVIVAAFLALGCAHESRNNSDGRSEVKLTFHEVKTAGDLEVASRYACYFERGIGSRSGIGSLAIQLDSNLYSVSDDATLDLVLSLPFKRPSRNVNVAIERATSNSHGRVWADYNNDKVFTTDEELSLVTFGARSVFGPLLSKSLGGDPVCYIDIGFDIRFIPTGWMEGNYTFLGKRNVVAAFDTNHDGEFVGDDDSWGNADHLVVGSFVGDEEFRRYRDAWPSENAVVKQLTDGSMCSITISATGTLAMIRVFAADSTLEVPASRAEIYSHTEPRFATTVGNVLRLPEGDYSWAEIRAWFPDSKGGEWQVDFTRSKVVGFKLESQKTTKLAISPPTKVHSLVERFGDTSISYLAMPQDDHDNLITNVIDPNGKRVIPDLVVYDKSGKVVDEVSWIDVTSVSYAGGGYEKHRAPFTYTITWDFGEFGTLSKSDVLK